MGQPNNLDIVPNVDILQPNLDAFRIRVCAFVQTSINALAQNRTVPTMKYVHRPASFTPDTFRILWNGDAVAVVRLDVRTQHGKITETHVWCRDDVTDAFGDKFLNTDEELDAQSASGASFFVAGCAA